MSQIYSNPNRATDVHALPDVETFYHAHNIGQACDGTCPTDGSPDSLACTGRGWYWWPCFPGCLPDGEPNGPFATEQDAIEDAQAGNADDDGSLDDSSDDEQEMTPDDDDYYLSDDERSIYSYGKVIVGPVPVDSVPCPRDAVLAELRLYMDRDQFWPNVWKVSDHGNVSLLTVPARVRYVQCAACSTESVYHRAIAEGWSEIAEGWSDEYGPVNSYTCEECQHVCDDDCRSNGCRG